MRKTSDRIRHAISFEIIGLALITPLGAFVFNQPMHAIGILGIVAATIATVWNFVYNIGFDHAMLRLRGSVQKSLPIRVLHAFLFEFGLLAALLPIVAWYLHLSLWEAFLMDISFALFYLVYAFLFNLAYDRVFPVPAKPQPAMA